MQPFAAYLAIPCAPLSPGDSHLPSCSGPWNARKPAPVLAISETGPSSALSGAVPRSGTLSPVGSGDSETRASIGVPGSLRGCPPCPPTPKGCLPVKGAQLPEIRIVCGAATWHPCRAWWRASRQPQRRKCWGTWHGTGQRIHEAARKPAWMLARGALRLRQTTTPAQAGVVVWRGRAQALRPVREGFEAAGLQAAGRENPGARTGRLRPRKRALLFGGDEHRPCGLDAASPRAGIIRASARRQDR